MCTCFSKKNVLYFLAGAAFWEALVHIGLHFYGLLPLSVMGYTITPAYNLYVIVGSLVLCVGLLWLARCSHCSGQKESCC